MTEKTTSYGIFSHLNLVMSLTVIPIEESLQELSCSHYKQPKSLFAHPYEPQLTKNGHSIHQISKTHLPLPGHLP